MPRLEWQEGVTGEEVSSEEHLEKLLRSLDADARQAQPIIVTLVSDDDRTLSIGLGRDTTVLSSTAADGLPPYFASDGGGEGTGAVYFAHGAWSEFPAWQIVPLDEGIKAMLHFLATGELLPGVGWREV